MFQVAQWSVILGESSGMHLTWYAFENHLFTVGRERRRFSPQNTFFQTYRNIVLNYVTDFDTCARSGYELLLLK